MCREDVFQRCLMLIAERHDLVRVHIGLSRLVGQCKALLDRCIILATCHASPGPHSLPFIPLRLVNNLPQVCQVSPQVKRTQPAVLVATTQGTTMGWRLQTTTVPLCTTRWTNSLANFPPPHYRGLAQETILEASWATDGPVGIATLH